MRRPVTLSLTGASVADNGNLVLGASANGFAMISGSPVTVASGATLSTTGSTNPAYLRCNITNQAGGTVTLGATSDIQDANTATTNNGSFTVSSGAGYSVNTGSDSFTNAGTLTVTGAMTESAGTFTQTSGSIVGNPVTITGGTIVDTAGTGAIDVRGGSTFSGTIPAGQTVTVDGAATSVTLNLTGTSVTDNGNLVLKASANGFAWLGGSPVTVASGATLSSTGSINTVYLRSDITNQAGGTVTLGATSNTQDSNTATTNNGSFTVPRGGLYGHLRSGLVHQCRHADGHGGHDGSAGTLTQTSGSIVGNPVTITGGTIVDTAGTGAIDVRGTTFSGTIPAGQTVTVDGAATPSP